LRLSALLFLALAGAASAQDKLVPGPGSTLTENKCKICHELQHIRRQPLSRGEWVDNLRNMKERGTPMTDAEMQVILEYLSTYYNRDKPAPPPSTDTLAAGGDSVQALLERNGCTGCHSLEQKVVGPAFREVARRYSSADADRLATKIREGTQGAWGPVPMPPNPSLSDADAQSLASWVLQQK
jgi:cytochrome c551/c552